MFAFINGKRIVVQEGETIGEMLTRQKALNPGEETLTQGADGLTVPADKSKPVEENQKLFTVPPIVAAGQPGQVTPARSAAQGATAPALSPRLQAELALLKSAVGNSRTLECGTVLEDGRQYTGVVISGIRLDPEKFDTARSRLLFLLPADYPAKPPIGAYLYYRHPARDHHFTLRSHYGAPSLETKGWYWYCVGLGGGFSPEAWSRFWHPGARPDSGHNLVTLYAAALHTINLKGH